MAQRDVRFRSSLRSRLVVMLVALAVVPPLSVAIVVGSRAFNDSERRSTATQIELAADVGRQLQTVFYEREAELVLLDRVGDFSALSRNEQRVTLRRLMTQQRMYQEIAVVDADASERARVSRDRVVLGSELGSRANDEAFQRALETGNTYFAPIEFDDEARESRMTIAYPLKDLRSGEVELVLIATVSFKPIWDLLASLELSDERQVFITDADGLVVAHANPAVVLRETRYPIVAENGRAIDLSGGEAIAAENRLSFGTQELIVVATQPVQLALEAATTGLRYTAIATGIALTAALAAALFFTIRVVRPVEKMAETAREIAAGDLSRRIEVKNLDEIGDLAAAINHLTSELGEVIGTLEQRVSDRTEDLEKAAVRQSALIEDLEAKNVEMALVQQQLEQLVQSKDEFLASVSHELRTPLASVVGFAAELRDHYVDFDLPEQLELIGMIAAQGQDMADIINDLLVAARAETGSLIVESTPVDLKAEVETVLSQLPEATVGFEAADAEIVVVADPVRVRQVLRNLVVNALRYGGPQVEINVSEAGEVATLQVRDNGAGIPNEDWEIIFDPYRRAHDRKGQPASVGLGLTVSRMLANRMQGDLSYRYDQGESVFELVLPVEDQRKPKRHEKHSSSVLPSGPTL